MYLSGGDGGGVAYDHAVVLHVSAEKPEGDVGHEVNDISQRLPACDGWL